MKITLPLINPYFDDNKISESVKKDIDNRCEIYVFKDEDDWIDSENNHAYSLWIQYGTDVNKAMMFDTDLDDLEMFANSLLKSIEMLRRDYLDVIKEKIKNGSLL